MMAYDIHGRQPSVERLMVHLPGMNRVISRENACLDTVIRNESAYKTMLTEWFVANQNHAAARGLTYVVLPTLWVWNNSQKVWTRRRTPRKLCGKIGRVYHIHPGTGELFFLRMLLMEVQGATCFADLKVYNGVHYDSFKEACQARGLVGDDNEWFRLFEEAIVWASPFQLRHFFMTVILFCEVVKGRALFEQFWPNMADDIAYRIRSSLGDARYVIPEEHIQDELLRELSDMFAKNGASLAAFDISARVVTAVSGGTNRLIAEESRYDVDELRSESEMLRAKLNAGQRLIFNKVIYAVDTEAPKVFFFVSGHGGTGKTFLWNCIVKTLRSEGRIVLVVASSGVASLLLPNGRTAHSRFRIPLDVND